MGGGGGPTNSTVTQSNLPEYARPFYENLMERGQRESTRDYTPYGGDRIANMTGATRSGLRSATAYGNSGTRMGGVLNQLQDVAHDARSFQNYKGSNYRSQNINFGSSGLDRVQYDPFSGDAAQQYMSPYMDAVVNRAQDNAVDQYKQQQATRNLAAARAGSFGGSRAAVQNSIAENQLSNNLKDIFVTGQQSAFENAQNQFNTDMARRAQIQAQNQGTALNFNLANQENRFNAAQLNEQSRQFGSQLGLSALDLRNQTAAQRMAALAQNDEMTQNRIQSLLGVGQTREEYQQAELDQRYADFVNQRDAERSNLQFLSSLLQGIPISANRDVTSTTSGNNLTGILGALGGMNTMNNMNQTTSP